jgi:hypothetical protein
LISGCTNEIDRSSFCTGKGYNKGGTFSNWEYASRNIENKDFYCVDLEKKRISDVYDLEGNAAKNECIMCNFTIIENGRK